MKYFLTLISLFVLSTHAMSVTFADGEVIPTPSCQPLYGGGTKCTATLTLSKAVQNPKDKTFVHNLTVKDPTYLPEQTVSFKIVVTNTSDKTVNAITIKDIFPQYLTFVSGPGSYDSKNRALSVKIDSLKADETKTFAVKMKIVNSDNLPKNGDTICLINQSTATLGKETVSDSSQFCIQNKVATNQDAPTQSPNSSKGGLPLYSAPQVNKTPSTGAESLILMALAPLSGLGILLKRRAK